MWHTIDHHGVSVCDFSLGVVGSALVLARVALWDRTEAQASTKHFYRSSRFRQLTILSQPSHIWSRTEVVEKEEERVQQEERKKWRWKRVTEEGMQKRGGGTHGSVKQETGREDNEGNVRMSEEGGVDKRQVRLIIRSGSTFPIDGSRNTYICTHRHSQALDDALKLQGLAPEGVVSGMNSSRSHHLGPLVSYYWVGCRKRSGNTKKGRKDSSICMGLSDCCLADTAATLIHTYTHKQIQGVMSRRAHSGAFLET